MKLAEIEVGESYAVSVNPLQVQGLMGDPEDFFSEPQFVARYLISDVADRALRGVKAEVVAVEAVDGRRKVRIRCVARKSLHKHYIEDNYDGTKTDWNGLVLDDEDNPVEEDVPFEALIEPSQVLAPWVDALVETEMRMAERILDHNRERYFS